MVKVECNPSRLRISHLGPEIPTASKTALAVSLRHVRPDEGPTAPSLNWHHFFALSTHASPGNSEICSVSRVAPSFCHSRLECHFYRYYSVTRLSERFLNWRALSRDTPSSWLASGRPVEQPWTGRQWLTWPGSQASTEEKTIKSLEASGLSRTTE